jgi:SAM-dependent MidA family methyltransferase
MPPLFEIIRRSGPITFEHYMALCLYHPEHGYYMQEHERTGVRGDYFTSPDLHPIFARLIARQAAEMWEILGQPPKFAWVEMGAGRGWFARDFLDWVVRRRPDFAAALDYLIVEPSPRRRARPEENFAEQQLPESLSDSGGPASARLQQPRVRVVASLEELEPLTGCFFSNELVDAFPVSVVTRSGGRLREIYVAAEGNALREEFGSISDPAIAAAVARYANQLEEGQRVEVNLNAIRWIRDVAGRLLQGFVLTIDYGDLAERLYTTDRPRGTLLAYRRHAASEDFFSAPGEQDLTSHVNFTALIDAGRETGLELIGLTTQERFLLGLGEANQFEDVYDPGQSESERLLARLKLKRLFYPVGMGGIFKVLIQHRGALKPELLGLRLGAARSTIANS